MADGETLQRMQENPYANSRKSVKMAIIADLVRHLQYKLHEAAIPELAACWGEGTHCAESEVKSGTKCGG